MQYIACPELIFQKYNEELVKLEARELPVLILISCIISTLPSEYFEFKSIWESVDVKNCSVDLLIKRICLIEKILTNKLSLETALVGTNRGL